MSSRCDACGLLTQTLMMPADEKHRLSLLRDLQFIGRKRGYVVTRNGKDVTYCAECVLELVGKSQPPKKGGRAK